MEIKPYNVPVILATRESLKGYAIVVANFEDEQVIINKWPHNGKRAVTDGVGGGVTEGLFKFWWNDSQLCAINEAVVGGDYIVCVKDSTGNIVVKEANYHPDGGQVVFPVEKQPFIALLGKTSASEQDDVRMDDFVGFYCDGSFGIQILPYIWHQPMIPMTDRQTFKNKQGAVHACVHVNFDEFSSVLNIRWCGVSPPA